MNEGWIKLHRSLLEWEWFADSNTFHVFIYLLLKANTKDLKYKGFVIPRGSLVVTVSDIGVTLGLSYKAVRTAFEHLKQSEQISDLLTYLGAPLAAMGIMEARLEKELNNKVNRRCNCDDANLTKVVEAAQEQLAAIRILRERGMLENLPAKLQQAAIAREKNPEAALTELAGMMDPPITKPAMNHRLKKLVEMAKETAK